MHRAVKMNLFFTLPVSKKLCTVRILRKQNIGQKEKLTRRWKREREREKEAFSLSPFAHRSVTLVGNEILRWKQRRGNERVNECTWENKTETRFSIKVSASVLAKSQWLSGLNTYTDGLFVAWQTYKIHGGRSDEFRRTNWVFCLNLARTALRHNYESSFRSKVEVQCLTANLQSPLRLECDHAHQYSPFWRQCS